MIHLFSRIWDLSLFTDVKKSKYSLFYIMASLIAIALIGYIVDGEVAGFIFLFYGLVIIYTCFVCDIKTAYKVTTVAFILHIIVQYDSIVKYYKIGAWDEIIVERFLVVILFFQGVLLFSKLLLKEHEAKENYKNSMEANSLTSKELILANANINELYVSTIQSLASAIEVKDPYTKGHSERVTKYAVALARELHLKGDDVKYIMYASILHDIGKIGIDEAILKKPAELTEVEFAQIKKHPEIGSSIISSIRFLNPIMPIILHHHEFYDGTGYPSGKKGEGIPLGARIIAVVDAYDAMIFDRPYRKGLSKEEAKQQILAGAGSQFDPEMVKILINILEKDISGKTMEEKLKN